MNTDDTIVLLAAAPATAYREYLYRPRSQLARWIDDRFDVVAKPGQHIDQALELGDVLLEVTLGRISPGRCLVLKANDPELEVSPRRLSAGQLLLRPRKRTEMSDPLPVEPTAGTEGSGRGAEVASRRDWFGEGDSPSEAYDDEPEPFEEPEALDGSADLEELESSDVAAAEAVLDPDLSATLGLGDADPGFIQDKVIVETCRSR